MTEPQEKCASRQPPTSLQVVSDLHLEYGHQYASFEIPPSAPYLILGGDTGCLCDYDAYLGFLQRHVPAFERIFLILGNHEFHGLSYENGLLQADRLVSEPALIGKVTLLQKSQYELNATTILLGCTLWSRIPPDAAEAVRGRVKDFKRIEGWSTSKHNSLFEDEVLWLKNAVAAVQSSRPSAQLLVVTHHAPSVFETSRPAQLCNPWTSAFSTDLLDEETWAGVDIWVFGHTHFTTEFQKHDVRVISNQRGYFLPGQTIEARSDASGPASFDVSRVVSLSNLTS
jgi:hypothetical protein